MLPQRGTGPFLSMGPVPLGTRPMQGFILLKKFTYLKVRIHVNHSHPPNQIITITRNSSNSNESFDCFKWFSRCIYSKV